MCLTECVYFYFTCFSCDCGQPSTMEYIGMLECVVVVVHYFSFESREWNLCGCVSLFASSMW